jgi:hypothetical protein
MRKKKHWRINQRNRLYDRFYLSSRASEEAKGDEESVDGEESEGDAEKWQEWDAGEEDLETTLCVFCPSLLPNPDVCFHHMKEMHKFDFFAIKSEVGT